MQTCLIPDLTNLFDFGFPQLDIEVDSICEYVTVNNFDALVQQADITLDCAFDFKERDLLNAACIRWNKPMIEAAMNSLEAYLTTIVPGETPCLTCLFPEKPEWDRWGFGRWVA